MSRRLDIGVVSYKNPQKLQRALESIERQSRTDWRCFIVHNPAEGPEDAAARQVIEAARNRDAHFVPIYGETNVGYAGGVNEILLRAETEYIAYIENDAEILTPDWDEKLCSYLDRFHEIGMIFPNGGAYPINRGPYDEIMWGVGFAFVINRLAMRDTGLFDDKIGHQNECDYALRLRMAGWKCAAAANVAIAHHATATNDPASIERMNRGVIEFMNKWNQYFGGKNLNYHSPNVLRWEDWPANALYLEEYWKLKMPELNKAPEVVMLDGREYDLIKVPRFKDFYRGRII